MVWKPAVIRAVRSFLQGCAAVLLVFLTALGKDGWVAVSLEGERLLLGLTLAAGYALVSFIQNFLELNTGLGDSKIRG